MTTREFLTISKEYECFGDIVASILGESAFTEIKEEIWRLDSDIPENHIVDFITGKAVYEPQSDVLGFGHAEEWQKQQFLFVCVCGHHRKPEQRDIDKRLRREEIFKFAEKYNIHVEDNHVAYAFDSKTFVKELQRLLDDHKGKEYLRFVLLGHGTRIEVEKVVKYALRTDQDAIPNPNVHGAVGNSISQVDPASLGNIDFHFLYCYAKHGAPEKDLHGRYTVHFSTRDKPWGILPKENYLCVAENFALKELGETLKKEAAEAARRCTECGAESAPSVNTGASPQAVLYSRNRWASSVDVHPTSPPYDLSHHSVGSNPSRRLTGSGPSSLQSLSSRTDTFSFNFPRAGEAEFPSGSSSHLPVASGGATENVSSEGSIPSASRLTQCNLNDPADVPDTPVDVLDACPSIHPRPPGTSSAAAGAEKLRELQAQLDRMRKESNRKQKENDHMKRQSLERSLTASQELPTNVQIHHPPAASSGDGIAAGARSDSHSRLQVAPGSSDRQGVGSERRLRDFDGRARGGEVAECADVVFEGAVGGGGDDRVKRDGALVDTSDDRVKRENPKKQRFKSVFSCLFHCRDKHK